MSEAYFAHPGVSNSMMKQIIRSPAHYIQWIRELPEASKKAHFRIGTALHHRLLDEGKPDRILIFDGTQTFKSKAGDAFLEKHHPQFICLTPDEMETVKGMEASIRADPRIMALINAAEREVEIYGEEETIYGTQKTKAMLDCLGSSYILDIKTTSDDLYWFPKDARRLYKIQAPWYQHMAWRRDGILRDFYFIAVETKPPYGHRIFKVGQQTLDEGTAMWKQALEIFARCTYEGVWPCYNNDLIEEI